jgi:hypothetical protein
MSARVCEPCSGCQSKAALFTDSQPSSSPGAKERISTPSDSESRAGRRGQSGVGAHLIEHAVAAEPVLLREVFGRGWMVTVRPAPGLGCFVEDRRQQPLAEALAAVVGGDEEFGGVTIALQGADSEADESLVVGVDAPDARGGLRLVGGVLTGGDSHESAGDLGGAIGGRHVLEERQLILGEGVDRGGGDCSAGLDSHAVTSPPLNRRLCR